MSKDIINVDGEDKVVREDTAKSYRGIVWALLSVGGFVIIAAILFFFFLARSATEGNIKSPAEIERNTGQ
ncbi:MAG: hypothetical protein ACR2F2_04895 [Pyrinomonadaceae bacterium]